MKRLPMLAMLLGAFTAVGCPTTGGSPPVSLDQYARANPADRSAYPDQTVLLLNLQRVLDVDLASGARLDSFKLVQKLAGDDPAIGRQVTAVLRDAKASPALRQEVLEYLLLQDAPDLAPHVMAAISSDTTSRQFRDAMLAWLARHSTPAVLADVVKMWALEPTNPPSAAEPRYRTAVERMAGKSWDTALLEQFNTPTFLASPSAMDVLAHRLEAGKLRAAVSAMTPQSELAQAIAAFLVKFDCLPADCAETLAIVQTHKSDPAAIDEAARMALRWQKDCGYRFNIRDFHLLSRLSRDPLRTPVGRAQLEMELTGVLSQRQHVASSGKAPARFEDLVKTLSMADLWNLVLINEMLCRGWVQVALVSMAADDRADARTACGGLICYENGLATPKPYQPQVKSPPDDLAYAPALQMLQKEREALCKFVGHFEKAENAGRAGPTVDELAAAAQANVNGLVLTSVDAKTFCAHYYTPTGVVVSLGKFPFGEPRKPTGTASKPVTKPSSPVTH